MLKAYREKQEVVLKQFENKLISIVDKNKFIEYIKNFSNQDFYERYAKRHEKMLTHLDYLKYQR